MKFSKKPVFPLWKIYKHRFDWFSLMSLIVFLFLTVFDQIKRIGFPVMLKASEGGGGKGIRKIVSEDEVCVFFFFFFLSFFFFFDPVLFLG